MILTCEMTDKLRHHYFNEIFQRLHLFTMEKPQVLNTPISFRFKIALTQKFVQKSFAHYFVCFYTSYNGYVFYLSRFQFQIKVKFMSPNQLFERQFKDIDAECDAILLVSLIVMDDKPRISETTSKWVFYLDTFQI